MQGKARILCLHAMFVCLKLVHVFAVCLCIPALYSCMSMLCTFDLSVCMLAHLFMHLCCLFVFSRLV